MNKFGLIGLLGAVICSGEEINISKNYVHVGDSTKDMFKPKAPCGTYWEKSFKLKKVPEKASLKLESIWSYSRNPIYINGTNIGYVPAQSRNMWKKDYKKYRRKIPFKKGEIEIPSGILEKGINKIRIESKEGRTFFVKNHDDFVLKNIIMITK